MNKVLKIVAWFCTLITLVTLFSCFASASEEEINELETKIIEVKDIEIADFENELEVGETITLSATVLPTNADEQTISYSSSNQSIATVSQTGEVKGVIPGDVKIIVSAGNIKKEINLTVKIASKGINVDKDYIVLKPNQSKQIAASIFPSNATDTNISYSSSDTSVATVSNTGLIKATGCGSTSIILKTANSMASVMVIVNDNSNKTESVEQAITENSVTEIPENVSVKDYPVISAEILKQLYKSKKSLRIKSNEYDLYINGEKLRNINNPLYTNIELSYESDKLMFNLNNGENLCGGVSLSISDAKKYKYLYLYDETNNKYKLIETSDITNLELSTAGKYLLTNSKISHNNTPWIVLSIGAGVFVVLLCAYIIIKRNYWFW